MADPVDAAPTPSLADDISLPDAPADDGHSIADDITLDGDPDAAVGDSSPHKKTHTVVVSRTPSQFHAATAPTAGPDPELSWGQVGQGIKQNFLPDLGQNLSAMGHSIMHPIQTVQQLGDVAKGVGSQLAGYVPGLQDGEDPKAKAQTEAMAKALEDHYTTAYGSVKGFKKALATAPVSTGMDVAAVADPALGGVAKVADVAGLGKVASGLRVAQGAANLADPIQAAVTTAKGVGKLTGGIGTALGSGATGIDRSLFSVGKAAMSHPDPAVRAAYQTFAKGRGSNEDIANAVNGAVDNIAQQRTQKFQSSLSDLDAAAAPNVSPQSWQPVHDGLQAAWQKTRIPGTNQMAPGMQDTVNQLTQIGSAIPQYMQSAAASATPVSTLENLRLATKNVIGKGGMTASNPMMDVYSGIQKAGENMAPGYGKMLSDYGKDSDNLAAVKQAVASSSKLPDNQIGRVLSSMKTGKNSSMLNQVMAQDPKIGAMLAGQAFSPMFKNGHGVDQIIGNSVMGGLMTGHPLAGVPGAVASAALQSPKLHGMLNGLGTRSSLVGNLAKPVERAAYVSSRPQADQDVTQTQQAPGETFQMPKDVDPHMQAVWKAESSGQQFKRDGSTVLGPETQYGRAVGMGQMLPDAAQQAAQLAGVPYDPQKLATDPQYNMKLSATYHEWLRQQFGGSEQLADAAYHAGIGNVHKAMAAARLDGRPWLSHLGPKTRSYVASLNPPGAFAAGGGVRRVPFGGRPGDLDQLRMGEGQDTEEPPEANHHPERSKQEQAGDSGDWFKAKTSAPQSAENAAGEGEEHDHDDEVHGKLPKTNAQAIRELGYLSRSPYAQGGAASNMLRDRLVAQLISRTKSAKKHTDASTKPLLNAHDDHIAKALEIAQRAAT